MKTNKQPSFEKLVQELETIVNQLEDGCELEDALKKYERGIELAKEAEKRLTVIENKFEIVNNQFQSDTHNTNVNDDSSQDNDQEDNLTNLPF